MNIVPWPAMSEIVGFTCSVSKAGRDRRIAAGTWGKPTDAQIAGFLRARLIAGDCPRFQKPNPVDMPAAFALYRQKAGDDKARSLLAEAFERQAAIPEEDGGDPIKTLVEKFAALAAANGMTATMDQIGEEHGR